VARNRRNKYQSPIWSWISFIIFGFLILLFGTSIWHRKSPAKVIKTWFSSAPSEDPIYNMSKSELRIYASDQQMRLDSLTERLELCQESVRSSIGTLISSLRSLMVPRWIFYIMILKNM